MLNNLINTSIYWQRHSENKKFYYAISDGILLLLRINNFPEEPLLTIIRGNNILDIEETPINWIIPWDDIA
jgi:hypothetical protein